MEKKLLKLLKESDHFISGEEIGAKMGVSRTSIWKTMEKLREQGYHIDAITKKGYRLTQVEDILNSVEIQEGLTTKFIGQKVTCFHEVDSTNDVARNLALTDAPDGTVIVADMQHCARGRLGRTWSAPCGTGIWMSIVLKPNLMPPESPRITLLAGLSVCRAIRKQTGLEAVIKWPNDILIHEKKVCGILTELNAEMEQIQFIILGIGINVNQEFFSAGLEDIATSLYLESGEKFARAPLLQAVLEEFEQLYSQYLVSRSFTDFVQQYRELCVTIGRVVTVSGRNSFEGLAVDIDNNGELIIRKESGQEVAVFSGEVSIRTKK